MSTEPKVSSRELRRELQRQAIALQRLGEAASGDFDRLNDRIQQTRIALQRLEEAASGDFDRMNDRIQQTREFLADVSARVDAQVDVNAERLQAETAPLRRDLWGRLRWLVTGR